MNDIPDPILHSLLAPNQVTRIAPAASGWGLSGARVYQAIATQRSLCLRRWPLGTQRSRIQEIHRVMISAREAGCLLVPEVIVREHQPAVMSCQQYVWDLTQWMAGRCLSQNELSLKRIVQAVEAIAQFHDSVADNGSVEQIPPAVVARLARIDQLKQANPLQQIPVAEEPLRTLAQRSCALWNANHESIRFRLTEAAAHRALTQWVLRDVHREHVLFNNIDVDETTVSGIIDFDAIRIDSPAVDLARFLGSCGNIPTTWFDSVVKAYKRMRPFCPQSEELIPLLDASTCLIACANWTQWLCVERQSFAAGLEKAINRYREVVDRTEILFQQGFNR